MNKAVFAESHPSRECLTPETYYAVSQDGPRTLVIRLQFPFEIDDWAQGNSAIQDTPEGADPMSDADRIRRYEERNAERKRICDLAHDQMEAVGADCYRVLRERDKRVGKDRVDYGVRHARWRHTREGERPSPRTIAQDPMNQPTSDQPGRDDVLPACPICRQAPDHGFVGDEDGGYGFVECNKASDGHFVGYHCDDEEEAIRLWSAALSHPQSLDVGEDEVERLRAALTEIAEFRPLGTSVAPVEEIAVFAKKTARAALQTRSKT